MQGIDRWLALFARYRPWLLAILALVALVYPLVVRRYYIGLLEDILIYAIFALSLDLLLGYTGLNSFGHAAYLGAGAYLAAYLAAHWGITNVLVTIPVAMGGAALLALLIGAFALRTSGIYFLMVTLAFAQMLFSVVLSWSEVTGGSDGLTGIGRPMISVGPLAYVFASRESFYYLVLACFALVWWLLQRLVASPFGWTLRGIRENEARLRALGYATLRYKLSAFVISGALAGLAGLLLAHSQLIASPEMLYWTTSGQVMIMLIVGGAGTLQGPILGAAVVRLLRNFISSSTERWETLMGVVFILFVLFARQGLIGLFTPRSNSPEEPSQ